MDLPRVQTVTPFHLIDTRHMGLPGTIGVYLVPGEEGFALVECGPSSTVKAVLAGVAEAGFDPADLSDVLVTHIHLDHAGAAGALAREYGAKVHVYASGAPHLADPSRLLKSAGRLYGDKMDLLWGEVEAVPQENLRSLNDGDTFDLLGHQVEVLYTPGHASSHVAYLFDGEALFTGDAAAIRLPGSSVVKPATAPPEVDLEAWDKTVAKMLAAKPERLLLTHFGEVKDVAGHLQAVTDQTHAWAAEVLAGLRQGEDDAALIARMERLGNAELQASGSAAETQERYRVTSDYELTTLGLKRYWQKHHPEQLES